MAWGRKSKNKPLKNERIESSSEASSVVASGVVAMEAQSSGAAQMKLEGKIRLSRWALLFEQIWPRIWLVIGVVGVFLLVSLMGLWGYLSPDAHRVVLGLFCLGLFGAVASLFFVKWPAREYALRRIELNSNAPHRPASSYEDQLSSDIGGETSTIWLAHKKRLAALLDKLHVGGPRPRVDARDPFALRALLTIAVVTLLVISGGKAPDRVMAAFKFNEGGTGVGSARVDAWVTPPVFTERAPIMLSDGTKLALSDEQRANLYEVPEGSQLVVRVSGKGVSQYGVVVVRGLDKKQKLKPNAVNDSGDLAEFRMSLDETLTIKSVSSIG